MPRPFGWRPRLGKAGVEATPQEERRAPPERRRAQHVADLRALWDEHQLVLVLDRALVNEECPSVRRQPVRRPRLTRHSK